MHRSGLLPGTFTRISLDLLTSIIAPRRRRPGSAALVDSEYDPVASGFYEWRDRPPSARAVADAGLVEVITDIHTASCGTYGVRRVHAELRLGRDVRVGRNRVERLMRTTGLAGIHRRRWRRHQPAPAVHADLINRAFVADAPDRLWVTDITQHRTSEGWVYCAVVLDVFSRRAVGWSIADHLRTELVVDAIDMARWRRQPAQGQTVVHNDRLKPVNTPLGCSVTDCAKPD